MRSHDRALHYSASRGKKEKIAAEYIARRGRQAGLAKNNAGKKGVSLRINGGQSRGTDGFAPNFRPMTA